MIDFTNSVEEFNSYRGSEKKKTLIYNDKKYLVKFPDPIMVKDKTISYINNAFSEYIGSNIFRICGFNVQNTILGKYIYNDKEKMVCACEDFTNDKCVLHGFENLALSVNLDKKIDTEINDIINVIDGSINLIDTEDIKKRFWDMFVIDSIIGNTDRHNGNWGFLINKETKEISFSPIYDCGSSLNPMLEDIDFEKMDDVELKNLAINCYSCLKENGKKINYMTYIRSINNKECNDAIVRCFNSIKIEEIYKFIDDIECMSEIRKKFYKNIIKLRYDIVRDVYNSLI